jgi:hypothetical protein
MCKLILRCTDQVIPLTIIHSESLNISAQAKPANQAGFFSSPFWGVLAEGAYHKFPIKHNVSYRKIKHNLSKRTIYA